MRRRFKTSRVCSSDNYKLSRKLSNVSKHVQVKEKLVIRKYYVKCFDKLIEITENEAICIYKSIEIIIE